MRQQKYLQWLVYVSNWISGIGLTGALPIWLTAPAGIISFIDFCVTIVEKED